MWRYGLAVACILGPLLMLVVVTCFISYLVPCTIDPRLGQSPPRLCAAMNSSPINLAYYSAADAPDLPPRDASRRTTNPQGKNAESDAAERGDSANRIMFLWGKDFYGRMGYAITSSFLFMTAGIALLFSLSVIVQWRSWRCALLALGGFTIITFMIVYFLERPTGRIFVVDLPLKQSDVFSGLSGSSSSDTLVSHLVDANTYISLIPVGMILTALAVLSIRSSKEAPDPDDLKIRRTMIHWALALGSAILVLGVLAQQILVDWPLSLLGDLQAFDLRPVADALTLKLGANGTLAMITAFGPAIVAWYLDVQRFRKDQRRSGLAKEGGATPAVKIADDEAKPRTTAATADDLVFAPTTMVLSIAAVIAPLIASPLVNVLKALLNL